MVTSNECLDPDEGAVPGERQDGQKESGMYWIVLIVSGLFEAVWAIALGMSDGLSKLVPSIVFFVALAISMGGLAYAMKEIPVGTAYAIWVGVGASLAVIYSMVTGQEAFSILKIVFILGLVGCVIGLKAVSN